MLNRGDAATLWGIERAKGARLEGKLVVPIIAIWKTINRRKYAGRLPHNTPVKIKQFKRSRQDGRIYYQVRGTEVENQPITGWVPHTFIKEHEE